VEHSLSQLARGVGYFFRSQVLCPFRSVAVVVCVGGWDRGCVGGWDRGVGGGVVVGVV
jgi:hypothetical protein